MQTIQQVSSQTLKLENYLKTKKQGDELTYMLITQETGIQMDTKGKAFLRTALKRAQIPAETFKGQGIKLLCSDNALRIVSHKTIRIDRATRKAEKTTQIVMTSDSFEGITQEGKQKLSFLLTAFGSIRLFANSAKKIFANQNIKIGDKIQ